MTRQDRTGQDRTGQDRTGQDGTGQDRTGQDRTGQDRTGQGKAKSICQAVIGGIHQDHMSGCHRTHSPKVVRGTHWTLYIFAYLLKYNLYGSNHVLC